MRQGTGFAWLRFAPILVGLAVVAIAFGWSSAHPAGRMMAIKDGPTYQTANSRPGTFERHSWTIRNESSSPLRLRTHFTSGRCGFSLWLGQERIIEGGQEFVVSLTWHNPGSAGRSFSSYAEVWTNDPDQPRVKFKVAGKTVTPQ